MKKQTRGGKRQGAGRVSKFKEKTIVYYRRIPKSFFKALDDLIKKMSE